jgi:serine/threonine protein kinase
MSIPNPPELKPLSKDDFNTKYPRGTEIGKGSFGKVYKVTNKNVVVKIGTYESLALDLSILPQISHQNIIKIIDLTVSENETMIAFPLGTSIYDYLNKNPNKLNQIFCELLCALDFLHKQNISHCDIKPENIVMISDHPILIDFGLSTICIPCRNDQVFYGNASTFGYDSLYYPGNYKSIKVDIYAMGKLFESLYLKENCYSAFPLNHNKELFEVFSMMLGPEPNISDVLKLKYFADEDVKCVQGYRIGQEVTVKPVGKIGEIFDGIYYTLVDWLIDVARQLQIDIRSFFLTIHNIHRTIWIFENISVYNRKNFQLFGTVHLALAESVFTGLLSVNFYLDLCNNVYNANQFNMMLTDLLKIMNCIIYTPTLWDIASSPEQIPRALLDTISFDYTFTPGNSSNNCDKYFNGSFWNDFVKRKWNTYSANKTELILKMIKDPEIRNMYKPSYVQKINLNESKPLNSDINPFQSGSLAVIYKNKEKLAQDRYLANNILQKVIDYRSDASNNYDIIFGLQKIKSLKGRNISKLLINCYLATLDEILVEILKP